MSLPTKLYTAEQVREFDRRAIEDHNIPGMVLMKRAGRAAFNRLLQCWPALNNLQVFCGGGNNGGDGYVIAALARQRNITVTVWQLSQDLLGDALSAYEFAVQEGVHILPYTSEHWQKASQAEPGVIVDALLGTGFSGNLRAPYDEAIEAINNSGWPVLSVDIPSGVNANIGSIPNKAIQADNTISFIGEKLGNVVGQGRVASGKRYFDSLNVPSDIYQNDIPAAELMELSLLQTLLPKRALDAHKGDFGHVMVVGGDHGYGGAPLMAAQMAVRCGAGLVSVATRPENTIPMITRQPEIMAVAVASGQDFLPLLTRPTVLVVGPGLGQSGWSEQLLYHVVHAGKPIVLDADALNIISHKKIVLPQQGDWVLTPHPGEAARLLGTSIDSVLQNRIMAIKALQDQYGGTIVLKGAGTLVLTNAGKLFVCDAGNPGMASGGMGDVLSGLIGTLLAQGLSTDDAACLGVLTHAIAADQVVSERGQRGLLATDLIEPVRCLLGG